MSAGTTNVDYSILQKKDLRNLIGAQKDRWPSDIAFNDKTKKQVLIQELLRPSNRFTTTVPIVTFDPAHGVRQTTPSKGNTENTLVPPPSRSQGNTTEDGTSNAQTAARQSNEVCCSHIVVLPPSHQDCFSGIVESQSDCICCTNSVAN